MSFVNGIINDLREKRLWPVALALVVALIAVPMLLSSSTKSQPLAQLPQTGPAAPAGIAVPAVSVSSTPTHSRLQGRGRDPFAQQKLPAAAASTGTATGSTGATTSTTSTTAQTSTTQQTTTTSTPTVAAKQKITYFVYAVDVGFGKVGRPTRTHSDVTRLTPFPSAKNPLVLFLGVRSDGKTAVFLVSSLAAPVGAGTCSPSRRHCDFLYLKSGQHERFLVVNSNGVPVEYQLRLSAVELTTTTSSTVAKLAHARVSTAGRRIVAQATKLTPTLRAMSFSVATGLLSYTPVAAPQLVHVGRQLSSGGDGVALEPVSTGAR